MRTKLEIPTALSSAETKAIQRLCDGRRVVECGALLGYATLAIAQVAAQVVSIDRHEGYGPPTLHQFLSNCERFGGGLGLRILPIVGEAACAVRSLKADAYFLDLDGTYETTLAVLRNIPCDAPILVHDFGRSNCDGVARAINAAGLEVVTAVDTLALCSHKNGRLGGFTRP